MLLNAAKCQDFSFYGFWVIKGIKKWRGGGLINPLTSNSPHPHRLGLKDGFSVLHQSQ